MTYPQTGGAQALWAVGSRGSFSGGFQVNSYDGAGGPRSVDARNYIYQLDATSLQAVSAPPGDRPANQRVAGAGTQIREFGHINTFTDIVQNDRAQTIVMTDATPANGDPVLGSGDRIVMVTPDGTTTFTWVTGNTITAEFIAETRLQFSDLYYQFIQPDIGPTPLLFRDGMNFEVTDVNNVTQVFEFETGRVLENVFDRATANRYDGSTIVLTDENGVVHTIEFDSNNNFNPANTRIIIDLNTTADILQRQVIAAIDAGPGGAWALDSQSPSSTDGVNITNRISFTGDDQTIGVQLTTGGDLNPFSLQGDYGTNDPAAVAIPVEEFFTNTFQAGDGFFTLDTPSAIDAAAAAVNAVPGFAVTAAVTNDKLQFSNAIAADFDNAAPMQDVGLAPGEVALPFFPTNTGFELNAILLNAVQAIEPLAFQGTDQRIVLPGRSFFEEAGTDDRLDIVPHNARLSAPGGTTGAHVTGLTFIGNRMFGVSDRGDLYEVRGGGFGFSTNGGNQGDFIESIYNDVTRQRVQFVSLTAGPRNAEGSLGFGVDAAQQGLDDILFGLDNDGVLYAFDTLGRPAHVFEDAAWFVDTGVQGATGIAFSNLDVNLWHETQDNRAQDPGHGVNISFDGSRRTQEDGGNSLYFGFEDPTDPQTQVGNWTGVNDPINGFAGYDATRENTYDFPGGAKGTIISNEIDLSDYSQADKPFLYFNYFLATENANANNPNDQNFMKDALRVYVAGDDGQWQQVATNNSDFDGNRLNGNDEFDHPFLVDPLGAVNRQMSELFDVGDNGAPDNWRQARVDLSRFTGNERLRIRFDFSTAGQIDGPNELVAVPGFEIRSGDTFEIASGGVNTTFEFDLGQVLQIPSGGALTAGQTFEVEGTTFTFAADNVGNNVQFSATDTAEDIANRIVAKLLGLGLDVQVDPRTPSRISIFDAVNPNPAVDPTLPASFLVGVPGVTAGNVRVAVHPAMTSAEVRDSIRTELAATFNAPSQEDRVDIVRFDRNTIFMWNKDIVDAGPLGSNLTLPGDAFGETNSGPTNQVGRGAERGQNNRFEGVLC